MVPPETSEPLYIEESGGSNDGAVSPKTPERVDENNGDT